MYRTLNLTLIPSAICPQNGTAVRKAVPKRTPGDPSTIGILIAPFSGLHENILCTNVFLFLYLHAFLRRPWVCSRASAAGHVGGPSVHGEFGSRAGSVARALGAQSRKIWQVITGSLSAGLEPSKTTKNPHVSRFGLLL